jgi:hypothetical protein
MVTCVPLTDTTRTICCCERPVRVDGQVSSDALGPHEM